VFHLLTFLTGGPVCCRTVCDAGLLILFSARFRCFLFLKHYVNSCAVENLFLIEHHFRGQPMGTRVPALRSTLQNCVVHKTVVAGAGMLLSCRIYKVVTPTSENIAIRPVKSEAALWRPT
jgi:hypothetical protein